MITLVDEIHSRARAWKIKHILDKLHFLSWMIAVRVIVLINWPSKVIIA